MQFSRIRTTYKRIKKLINCCETRDAINNYLLLVIFTQFLQLLALVVFNAVQHGINLPCLVVAFVISVTQRAAVHANQFDYSEADEYFPNELEHQGKD